MALKNRFQSIKIELDKFVQGENELYSIFKETGNLLEEKHAGLFSIPENFTHFSVELSSYWLRNVLQPEVTPFADQCSDFLPLLEKLEVFKEQLSEVQSEERFYKQAEDSIKIRLFKNVKRRALKAGWAFIGFKNIFRKSKVEKKFWEHIVLEKSLAEYVFVNRFLEELLPLFEQIAINKEKRLKLFYQIDKFMEGNVLLQQRPDSLELSVKQIKQGINLDQKNFSNFFEEIETNLSAEFNELKRKAGTIEFPSSLLDQKRLKKERERLLVDFDLAQNRLHLSSFAIAEHWRLKLQNRLLLFDLLDLFKEQRKQFEHQIAAILKPAFINFKKELNEFVGGLLKDENVAGEAILAFKKEIPSKIDGLIHLVRNSKLASLFEKPLIEIEKKIQITPESYFFASTVFDEKPVLRKHLKKISTRNILSGSILSALKNDLSEIQTEFALNFQKLGNNFSEVRHLVEYTIDFYIEQGDKHEGLDEFREGLQRSVRKSEDSLVYLSELESLVAKSKEKSSLDFAEMTITYFETDRLFQTEKENDRKAFIERNKKVILSRWETAISFVKKSNRWLLKLYADFYARYFNLRNLLGISEDTESISTELSNYLSETMLAIKRLPVMYQKLFELSPLTDERFYIPRKNELSQLNEAYDSWRKGNFAPTCIVGEQGSGATTLFNFFTSLKEDKIQVKHHIIPKKIYEKNYFLDFFRSIFPDLQFSSFEEMVVKINAVPEQQVIILENIHNLFIRKNGAMNNLLLFFKLISQTNRNVFWLCSCYVYSWKLLDYTLNISGYFGHTIHFGVMPSEMIQEVIFRRHKVSGYKLSFMEPNHHSFKRGYQKLSEDEKQEYLVQLFFDELWTHAQSNISMAFIFWLRAIVKVDADTLYIQNRQLDYGFLNSLKEEELTTLHAILVHGGLTLTEHAAIFNNQEDESERQLMVLDDDGLLDVSGEKYVINPLVYRTLVSQLKSRNFIY